MFLFLFSKVSQFINLSLFWLWFMKNWNTVTVNHNQNNTRFMNKDTFISMQVFFISLSDIRPSQKERFNCIWIFVSLICSLAGVCGANALCIVLSHTPLCSCQPGFTGNPTVGCSPILTCSSQANCPANLICAFGVCSPPCSSIRDCLDNQVCVNEKCVPRCNKNSQCPEFHECRGGVCALAEKCRSNDDCATSESCTTAFSK